MRPWLVVIGVVFLTLAGGTLAIIYFGPGANPTTVVTTYPPISIGANASVRLPFDGANGTSEQFSLDWQSSASIRVTLEEAGPCPGNCTGDQVLFVWTSNLSGTWTGDGPFRYPLLCVFQNPERQSVLVSLSGRSVASTVTHFPLETELILGSASAGLLLVAGISTFLGLFLQGDLYGPPHPLPSRSADDAEEIGRKPPP